MKRIKIPKDIYRNIHLRLTIKDTGFDDLLDYVRVQLNSVYYTNHG